jgi:hypothetical protein
MSEPSSALSNLLLNAGVAIFGVVVAERGAGGLRKALEVAKAHLHDGADSIDLHLGALDLASANDVAHLRELTQELRSLAPCRVAMLGQVSDPSQWAVLDEVAMFRATSAFGEEVVVDSATGSVIARCCLAPDKTMSDFSARLRLLRCETSLPLHVEVPDHPRGAQGNAPLRQGVLAADVAFLITQGATLLSVSQVLSAVKARDEMVQILHAK